MAQRDEQAFEAWMQKTDAACQRLSGLSIHDLADQCFSDMFEDGITPTQMAKLALQEEGF